MYILAQIIHSLFPLSALILLMIGIKRDAIYYVVAALWLSLISLIIHYQSSGGEILGSYFNNTNATIYTVNLLILFVALVRVISHLGSDNDVFRYVSNVIKAFLFVGIILVITNLMINAYFIDNRLQGTPIMQVGLFDKPDYCAYHYVFYKVSKDGSVMYLCPNHYGLIPSIGHLDISPDFISMQLSLPSKNQPLLQPKTRAHGAVAR